MLTLRGLYEYIDDSERKLQRADDFSTKVALTTYRPRDDLGGKVSSKFRLSTCTCAHKL